VTALGNTVNSVSICGTGKCGITERTGGTASHGGTGSTGRGGITDKTDNTSGITVQVALPALSTKRY
jgi:hypothetical protein